MAPVSQAPRRYLIELSGAMLLYAAALFGRVYLLKGMSDPVLRVVVTLSPVLPILLGALVIFRFYRRMDEYHRLRLLKTLAITGGVTAVSAASWSFLQDAGAPPLSNYGVLTIVWIVYITVTFLFRLEEAVAEGRIGKVLRNLAWLSVLAGAGAVIYWQVAQALGWPWTIPLIILAAAGVIIVFVSLCIGPSAETP